MISLKQLAIMAHKALDMPWTLSRRYAGKSPGEIVAARLDKKKQERASRQRRRRWSYKNRRYPCNSHRRTS